MKHIFIINPAAGARDLSEYLVNTIKGIFVDEDYLIHITTGTNDARDYAKSVCERFPSQHKRFYSCGGDGTLNEVLNGIIDYENVSLTCYPAGSGNDFVKNFGDIEDFLSFENLRQGKSLEVDVMQFNDKYALNVCNLGFDGEVAYNFHKFKRLPFVSGKRAYRLSIFWTLLSKMKHKVTIHIDDELVFDGKILLTAIANGYCYGGAFHCAPHAIVNDGLLDCVIIKPLNRLKLLRFMKHYRRGKHLEHKKFSKKIIYQQAKKITITSEKPLAVSFDGEVIRTTTMDFSILPKRINFVAPDMEP